MQPDDHVCLCFRVSLRKLTHYMNRIEPRVPSQLADCLGAGTGCHWCVPFLCKLHAQWERGETPDLPVAPEVYAARRKQYHKSGEHDETQPDLNWPTEWSGKAEADDVE
ncbi:MAG: (2Fe-2S)-binding protein [Phycisphaerales bacterium]